MLVETPDGLCNIGSIFTLDEDGIRVGHVHNEVGRLFGTGSRHANKRLIFTFICRQQRTVLALKDAFEARPEVDGDFSIADRQVVDNQIIMIRVAWIDLKFEPRSIRICNATAGHLGLVEVSVVGVADRQIPDLRDFRLLVRIRPVNLQNAVFRQQQMRRIVMENGRVRTLHNTCSILQHHPAGKRIWTFKFFVKSNLPAIKVHPDSSGTAQQIVDIHDTVSGIAIIILHVQQAVHILKMDISTTSQCMRPLCRVSHFKTGTGLYIQIGRVRSCLAITENVVATSINVDMVIYCCPIDVLADKCFTRISICAIRYGNVTGSSIPNLICRSTVLAGIVYILNATCTGNLGIKILFTCQ